MKILRTDNSQNIILNTETDFQTDLGWEDNMMDFETEVLNEIINPLVNYETIKKGLHSDILDIKSNKFIWSIDKTKHIVIFDEVHRCKDPKSLKNLSKVSK